MGDDDGSREVVHDVAKQRGTLRRRFETNSLYVVDTDWEPWQGFARAKKRNVEQPLVTVTRCFTRHGGIATHYVPLTYNDSL